MDTVVVALRVALSLGVVLALLWVLQRKLSKGLLRGNGARARRAATVTVVARQGIGGKASVVVVDVEGERLVLGVTESQVNVLSSGEAPAPVLELVTPIAEPTPFSAVLAAQDQAAPSPQARPTDRSASDRNRPEGAHLQTVPAAEPLPMRPRNRARRTTARRTVVPTSQQLQGSILSADTWKQAAAAVRARRAG